MSLFEIWQQNSLNKILGQNSFGFTSQDMLKMSSSFKNMYFEMKCLI